MAASAPSGMYVNMNSGAVQAGLMPFRNALINGDMRINQRGTSTNLASLTGVATVSPGSWATDRWNVYRDSFAAGSVIGQGTNLTNADLPFSDAGIKTFGRIGRLNGNTGTNNIRLNYNIESQDCYQYVGKVVTLSFYYRTGTNFSGSTLITNIFTGTGTDQAIRSNYTGSIVQATTNIPSLIWRRVSFTVTLSSLLNQIGLDIQYTPVGTAGANDYFDITGIQLELGSVPTSFEVRPFSVELQMCQRYYEKTYSMNVAPGTNSSSGLYYITAGTDGGTGYVIIIVKFTVAKRNNTYNVLGYREDGTSNQWLYARSGSTAYVTPIYDSKSEFNFRLLVNTGTANVVATIIGHWVADAEI